MGDISERKKAILKTLVENYIVSADPVSSSSIRDSNLGSVSGATIRNELASLEEMGYLVQPHVSAGRIPSSKAYRYYIENFMEMEDTGELITELRERFSGKLGEVEEVVKDAARAISDITNYTSVIVMGDVAKVTVKEVKLVTLTADSALLIIITDGGIIKDNILNLPSAMDNGYLSSANVVLNDIFAGRSLGDITDMRIDVGEEMKQYGELFEEIIKTLIEYKKRHKADVYLEGTNKIFSHKEYDNIDNVKNFMRVISEKDKLCRLVVDSGDIEISIKIGKDDSEGLDNMALVTAQYTVGGRKLGHAGVIGPERMNYKKVISVLSGIGSLLSSMGENTGLIKGEDNDK